MGIRVPHLRLPFQRPRLEDEIEACVRAGTGLRQEQCQQLEAFLHNLDVELLNRLAPPLRFAAVLFSWGEVAKATVFADRP